MSMLLARSYKFYLVIKSQSNMAVRSCAYMGCHAHINYGEIYDCTVKVLTENFYCSIALIKFLRVLSLKFCLTLDRFDSECCSLTVDFRKYFESTVDFAQIYPQCICAQHHLVCHFAYHIAQLCGGRKYW